jgi:hypothetical protein
MVSLLLTTIVYAEWVNGYSRSDGTYVNGYNRSDRNGTVTDNYSFEGNTNPYTGKEGHNYYRNNPTSPYYNGTTKDSSSSGIFGSSSFGKDSDKE